MNTEEVLRIGRGKDKDIRTNSIEKENTFSWKPGVADPDTEWFVFIWVSDFRSVYPYPEEGGGGGYSTCRLEMLEGGGGK